MAATGRKSRPRSPSTPPTAPREADGRLRSLLGAIHNIVVGHGAKVSQFTHKKGATYPPPSIKKLKYGLPFLNRTKRAQPWWSPKGAGGVPRACARAHD